MSYRQTCDFRIESHEPPSRARKFGESIGSHWIFSNLAEKYWNGHFQAILSRPIAEYFRAFYVRSDSFYSNPVKFFFIDFESYYRYSVLSETSKFRQNNKKQNVKFIPAAEQDVARSGQSLGFSILHSKSMIGTTPMWQECSVLFRWLLEHR